MTSPTPHSPGREAVELIQKALAKLPADADSPWMNLDKMPYIHKTDDPKASPWNCTVVGRFDYLQTMDYMLACQPSNIRAVLALLAEAQVAEFGAQSANRHLSALIDFERQVVERCMAVMKALMDAAEPVNNEFQDCHIDYADYAKFVDAHAELLYVIKNGERPKTSGADHV